MLKILQARLQQYVNRELPDVQAGFRKGRGTRDQIANIQWIIKKAREFQKNIYFCFTDYAKAFDCVDHNKLWKIPSRQGGRLAIHNKQGSPSSNWRGRGWEPVAPGLLRVLFVVNTHHLINFLVNLANLNMSTSESILKSHILNPNSIFRFS